MWRRRRFTGIVYFKPKSYQIHDIVRTSKNPHTKGRGLKILVRPVKKYGQNKNARQTISVLSPLSLRSILDNILANRKKVHLFFKIENNIKEIKIMYLIIKCIYQYNDKRVGKIV